MHIAILMLLAGAVAWLFVTTVATIIAHIIFRVTMGKEKFPWKIYFIVWAFTIIIYELQIILFVFTQ